MAETTNPDLRDQRMPFMFEVWADSLTQRYVMPINPEEYRIRRTPKAKVVQTRGKVHQFNFGNAPPTITMRGTFSYLGSLPGGKARTVSGAQLCGWDLFKELEALFLDFYDRYGGTAAPSPTDPPELRFYNFTDEHYFVVQKDVFELERSLKRRHLYQYNIQLTAISTLGEAPTGVVDTLGLAGPPEDLGLEDVSFWAEALEGYTWISAEVSDAVNYMQDLEAKLTTVQQAVSSFRQGITDLIEAPFELVSEAIDTVDIVITAVGSLAELPDEFRVALRETKRNLLNLRDRSANVFREPPDPWESIKDLATTAIPDTTGTEIMTSTLPRADVGAVEMVHPESTLFVDDIEPANDVPVGEVVALSGDTLQSIASRVLGSAAGWRRIALINDFEAPYELTAGQRVRIPGLGADNTTPILDSDAAADAVDWETRVYGTDEELDQDGNHKISGAGDVGTVGGVANLVMQLQHRLNTRRGELAELGHPTYGGMLPDLIGKISTDYWMERARVEARMVLLEDPRVAAVGKVTFTEQNGVLYLDGDVQPVNQSATERVLLMVGGSL